MGASEIISLLKRTKRKMTNKEIAMELHKNPNSISSVLKRLRQKLFYPFISYDIIYTTGRITEGKYMYVYWYDHGEGSNY